MSSYIERWCPKHGEWDDDVDCPGECPACEKEGIAPSQIAAKEHAELAALRAENARYRDFIETVSLAPTPEDPQARLEGIVARARLALTGTPAGIFLTLEQARELAHRRECPACGETVCGSNPWHAPDCWLARAIKQAEEGTRGE